MTFHNKSKEETLTLLSANEQSGLSAAEVSELSAKFGENKLREKKKML